MKFIKREIPDELLTGNEALDAQLRKAFDVGFSTGMGDREELIEHTTFEDRKRFIALLLQMGYNLDNALNIMQLPKAQKKIFTKIFLKRQPKQKNNQI